jgi:hypothetical protein
VIARIEVEEGNPPVVPYPARFRQSLTNLILSGRSLKRAFGRAQGRSSVEPAQSRRSRLGATGRRLNHHATAVGLEKVNPASNQRMGGIPRCAARR